MTALRQFSAREWVRTAGWLVPDDNASWLRYMIVRRAFCDDGIMEVPWGSNHGTRIDAYADRSGSPRGSYWCGLEVGAVFADCGALVPDWYGATANWESHVTPTPQVGSAILYGTKGKPVHIEIVARTDVKGMPPGRWDPYRLLTIGGNRGYGGSGTNNGVACSAAPMLRGDVLGFIDPVLVPGWTIAQFAPAWFLLEHLSLLPAREKGAALSKIAAVVKAVA